jgi:hypothetical protein
MSRVSTGVARAFEFARHDPVNDPRVTAPPRPPRPSLATVRLPPIKREIFFLILTRHFVRHPAGRSLRGRQRRVRPSAPASQRAHYERRRRRVVPGSARVFQSRDDVASMRAIRRRARRRDKRATRLRDFSVFKKRFWRFAFRAAFGEDHVRSSGRAREPRTRVGSLRRFAGRAEAPRRLENARRRRGGGGKQNTFCWRKKSRRRRDLRQTALGDFSGPYDHLVRPLVVRDRVRGRPVH